MKTKFYFLAILSLSAALLLSCSKEDVQVSPVEPVNPVVEQEIPAGKLISATKVDVVPANEAIEEWTNKFMGSENLLSLKLLGMELADFDIVTYRIKYNSTTIQNGVSRDIVLAGDVSFIAERTGLISTRHLSSVTLFNTVFNTSKEDVTLVDNIASSIRSIYNALVVYPFYQGGPDSDTIYATPCELLIKGKQAIDCELAALEFIESLDGVEMMSGYYTENVGVSNGGGPALAVAYLLENDCQYKQLAEKINLRSTYVGAGNCSTKSLIANLKTVNKESAIYPTASTGFITAVAGAYYTWKGDEYFKTSALEDYFSECVYSYDAYKTYLSADALLVWEDEDALGFKDKTVLDVYSENLGSLYFYSSYVPGIQDAVNSGIFADGDFIMDSDPMKELLSAFDNNEVICSGWSPKTAIKFAHSKDDEFLLYDVNYNIWKNLSNNGRNRLVKLYTVEDLDHTASTTQFLVDVISHKHPFNAESDFSAEDIMSLLM